MGRLLDLDDVSKNHELAEKELEELRKLAKFGAMVFNEMSRKEYVELDLVEFELWGLKAGLFKYDGDKSNLAPGIKEAVEELLK